MTREGEAMGDPIPSDILVSDPLTDVTRKERRTMLGTAAVGIGVAKTRLVPTKIESLGITFSAPNQKAFLETILAVVIYFTVAFILYALCDWVAWRNRYHMLIWDRDQTMNRGDTQQPSDFPVIGVPFWVKRALSEQRALFEFVVPLFIVSYAMWVLVTTIYALPSSPRGCLRPRTEAVCRASLKRECQRTCLTGGRIGAT